MYGTGRDFESEKLPLLLACSLCFVLEDEDMGSQFPALTTMSAICGHASLAWWTLIPLEP